MKNIVHYINTMNNVDVAYCCKKCGQITNMDKKNVRD